MSSSTSERARRVRWRALCVRRLLARTYCALACACTGALWMLADGHSVGLSNLLRAAPPEIDWRPFLQVDPQTRAEPAAKLMALEVCGTTGPTAAE